MIDSLTEELFFVHDDFAVTQLSLYIDGEFIFAEGTARREPQDKPSRKTAELLSYGRALDSLAKKVLRRAEGMVKHNDDMRDRSFLLKQRKAEALVDVNTLTLHKFDLAPGESCPYCSYTS